MTVVTGVRLLLYVLISIFLLCSALKLLCHILQVYLFMDHNHCRRLHFLISTPRLVQTPHRICRGASGVAADNVDYMGVEHVNTQCRTAQSLFGGNMLGSRLLWPNTDIVR